MLYIQSSMTFPCHKSDQATLEGKAPGSMYSVLIVQLDDCGPFFDILEKSCQEEQKGKLKGRQPIANMIKEV